MSKWSRSWYGLCGLMLVALMALAQRADAQMFVEPGSFLAHSTKETTAHLPENKRMDDNAQICAIIKITTMEKGFEFSGGTLGVVGQPRYLTGEVWIWVEPGARFVDIRHSQFGKLNYQFPEEIEAGRVYEMRLNPGTGRYVNITSSGAANAEVVVDGVNIGRTPINNYYLSYGRRVIHAQANRYEADTLYTVTRGDGMLHLDLAMVDQTKFFGRVNVSVDGNADIYFQGKKVGTGTWRTELREGTYDIVTKKIDCADATTQINVVAQRTQNVTANAPVPYTGTLVLFMRPARVDARLDGKTEVNVNEPLVLPIGTRRIEFSRKGYVSQEVAFNIKRNEVLNDSVTLEKISYLKPKAFYFGVGYTLSSLPGLTATIGGIYKRHDLSASYTLGLGASDNVYWYNASDGTLASALNYKRSSWGFRYGYQIGLLPRLGFTPQVGFTHATLSGSLQTGSGNYGNAAAANILTVGVKILAVPVNHLYLYVAPEYGMGMSKDEAYERVANNAGFSIGGFSVTLGAHVNF